MLRLVRLTVSVTAMSLIGVAAAPGALGQSLPSQADQQAVMHTHGADGKWIDPPSNHPGGPAVTYDRHVHAEWRADQWDGRQFTTDQTDLTTLPTFHAIYMYPKDGVNRFSTFAAMFQADAVQADSLLQARYQRGVRWDYRAGACYKTETSPGGPCVDITVVKARSRTSQFSSNAFSTVKKEVDGLFKNPNKKYVVWLDMDYRSACGQGHLYQDTRRSPDNNSNLGRTLSVVYRAYPNDFLTGGFCRGTVVLHEIGHNMGAVQRVAPHAFDGAHCNDSNEDVMCYINNTAPDTGDVVFDWGTDDYWDPAANPDKVTNPVAPNTPDRLPWWTVNLSRFVCPRGGDCEAANVPEF